MLLFIRIFLIIYGLISAATGYMGTTAKFNPAITDPMTDNNHRYVAAIWMATSLAFFYVAWNPSETALFRFLMIALIIGGLVRAAALVNYPATPFLIFLIAIELIPTTLMLWFHTKLLNAGSL
ncbi:protein of unknown function [Algoriphagus locisalis]|uniref:DUF4345 domain-containing protein n=1 Tax=Algoriphagus locisalis TaxID=305507 RepID=A0A1I7BF21_9BACT|nr:DUF4345 family protein [Algoriphagus locisalis]SFT85793.1 protein of unknown function [Algoriphagus locisalis]